VPQDSTEFEPQDLQLHLKNNARSSPDFSVGRPSDVSPNMVASAPPEVKHNERLADYFAIVGLPEELKPLDNGYDTIRTIEKLEIVIMERWEVSEIKKLLHQ